MKTFENTFIRGPSPSYSDEVTSEHMTLPVGSFQLDHGQMKREKRFPNKMEDLYDGQQYDSNNSKPVQGRNTFAFWAIVVILLVLTIGNLLLTLSIIGVLHLGKGIYGMELIPEEDVVKFYGETDLDRIFSKNIAQFEGFLDDPVTIEGDNGPVYVRMHHRNSHSSNRLTIEKSGIQFRGVNSFELKDPNNGETLFTTHRPHYSIPNGANVLISKVNSASRIVSPGDKHLMISSTDRVSVRGSEGILLDAADVSLKAEQNILINTTQGATYLEGGSGGIFLDMKKIPIVNTEMGLRTGSVQYKICVCMPQGIVFRIEIPQEHNGSKISCAHFSLKHDPCNLN